MLLRRHPDEDSKDCRTSAPSLRMIAHRPSNESQSEVLEPTSQADPRDGFPRNSLLSAEQVALRLLIAFGLLVGLLLAVGQLGLSRMDRANADLDRILGRRWAKLQLAREALTYSSRNSRLTMEIFLTTDRTAIASLLVTRAENSQKISGRLQEPSFSV